ncbi:MAG: hypothetical protein ACM3NE_09250, partial [Hyphomicrobiales bacterium]
LPLSRPRQPRDDRSESGHREAGRLELTGFPGWLFWSVAHVYFLVNLRTRLFVAISWIAAYFTYHRGARIITK